MHNERNKLTSDLADFVDNPQGIAGDVEYCSMVVAFALLQLHTRTRKHITFTAHQQCSSISSETTHNAAWL